MPRRTDPLSHLRDCLSKLPAAGENGFEGLLRDSVAKLIGRRLSLAKGGGAQGGSDMASAPYDDGPTIAIEAKRYGPTRIRLDELKYKIGEAVERRPDLDIMVFGATREINANDRDALIAFGSTKGIGVATIDWPDSATIAPQLAVLCALVPEALLDLIEPAQREAINSCLDQMQSHPQFECAKERLIQELIRPDMGWSSARFAMADWLRRTFSNRNLALADLKGWANLLDSEVRLVPRPWLVGALDEWWADPGKAPFAMVGEEGVGKSWAPFAWWHERAGSDGSGLPLPLVVPATEIGEADIEGLVASLLARRTGLRDDVFWKRRVGLWLKAHTTTPRFLLVIDGLNEHWSFTKWDEILARFAAEPWRGKAAIIITDRPDHWEQVKHSVGRVQPPPQKCDVVGFSDEELNNLLELHGMTRDMFAPELIPLMKIPRLSTLAIRHHVAMADSGDITRERLIYLDWSDRMDRKGMKLVDDIAFREYIAGVGRQLHARLLSGADLDLSITRRNITDTLSADSDRPRDVLDATVSEIVAGLWMSPIHGKANRFRLNKDLVPFALALGLVDHLRDVPPAGLNDQIAQFFEPLKGQDLAVDFLRAAVTIALHDSACSTSLRRILLEAWCRRQNFRQVDFAAFYRLLTQDISVFFALAEDEWLHRHSGFHLDEILIKGFASAAERWPRVHERILVWCSTWLGTHWGDPIEKMVIGYDPAADGVAERCARTRDRRISWDAAMRGATLGSFGSSIPIRSGIDGDVSWLACRVIGILSYLPCALIVPALTPWAVSRSIMNGRPQAEQVEWVLRLAGRDGDAAVNAAVQREADQLLAFNNHVAKDAAWRLLAAFATPHAASRAKALTREVSKRRERSSTVTVDDGGFLRWNQERCRSRETTLWAAGDLSPHATNPECELSDQDAAALAALVDATDASQLWAIFGQTDQDIALEQAEAALARWAPEALGALVRRTFECVGGRDQEGLKKLADKTSANLFLLDTSACAQVSEVVRSSLANDEDGEGVGSELQLAALAGKTAQQQIAFFCECSYGSNFDRKHAVVLNQPTEADFDRVAEYLFPDAPVRQLRGWLWYLSHVSLDALPRGYPTLAPLFRYKDDKVRQLALEVAANSNQPELAVAVADSGWLHTEGMNREEAIDGSLALIKAASHLPADVLRSRIDPQAWGYLAIRDGATEDDLDAFAEVVKRMIHDDLFGQSPSKVYPQRHFILREPIDRLVERQGEKVINWLRPIIHGTSRVRFRLLCGDFLYIDLCRALFRYRPDDGAALWQSMRKENESGIFKSSAYKFLPFEAPDSELVSELRHHVCDAAKTDEDFGQIAAVVIKSDREIWLIERIQRELAGPSAGSIARGLWLAGLLNATPGAENLWATTLAVPPGPGWLADVYDEAQRLYCQNGWAQHWLEAFLTERDRDRAFGYYRLFLRCADRRALVWASRRVDKVWGDLPELWRVHWMLSWEELCAATDERAKASKEYFCGTKITTHIQWPWR
ncbi:hypothetical protein CCR92_17665 [Rhodospirillum rubrum]|nr:hypothetical protein [Rhodospirillum rubrum]